MGYIYLLLVVLAITAVALIAKIVSRLNVSAFGLSACLFFVSTMLGAVILATKWPVEITPMALLISTVAGVGGAFAVLAFNHAVRKGHFGFSNAIYRSSFLIPVVYSVLFLGAELKFTTVAGILLITVAIFLMSWSSDSFSKGKTNEFRWFLLIFVAFLLSGAPRVGQTLTKAHGVDVYLYLFLSYATGAAVFLLEMLRKRSFRVLGGGFGLNALLWGSAAAIASYIGVFCTLQALNTLKPQVVFPISLSGPIIAGMILSLMMFREIIRPAGWAGVALGVAGITILAIWK